MELVRRKLVEHLAEGKKPVKTLTAYPDISVRAAWEALPEEVKCMLLAEGERSLAEPWTQLFASDYMEFSQNGNRSHFQDKLFARRTMLNALVLAECVEHQGRFMEKILDGIFLMLEESTWCLPAHNAYIRDTKQFPLPDYTRPVIDLFQAETGAVLAVAEYLLRPALAELSPFISKDINARLEERIFTPYLNTHFWWMGNGEEPVNNWTAWCTQNVLLAVFTRPAEVLEAARREQIFRKAVRSVDYFLDEYGEDGCCDEGAQYYGHAGLTLFNCLAIFDEITDGGMAALFREPLVQNIAAYIARVYIGKQNYVNFADCSPFAGRRSAREFLFGKRCGDEALAAFAAKDYVASEDKLLVEEHNLYYRLQQVFAHADMCACAAAHKDDAVNCTDVWFPSVGLMIARDGEYTLAVKAGDNADSHNHNDVGSFTLYKHAEPFLIDLGVETYTQKTFSPQRYEIWTMQSQYHNLPSFIGTAADAETVPQNGLLAQLAEGRLVMQQDGEAFAASQVNCELTQEKAALSMELAAAYPDVRVKTYHRSVTLERGSAVLLEDVYEGELDAVLSLMTYEKPELVTGADAASGMQEIRVGTLGSICVTGAGDICIEACPITDERLQTAWKHDCYRILLPMQDGRLKLSIR